MDSEFDVFINLKTAGMAIAMNFNKAEQCLQEIEERFNKADTEGRLRILGYMTANGLDTHIGRILTLLIHADDVSWLPLDMVVNVMELQAASHRGNVESSQVADEMHRELNTVVTEYLASSSLSMEELVGKFRHEDCRNILHSVAVQRVNKSWKGYSA